MVENEDYTTIGARPGGAAMPHGHAAPPRRWLRLCWRLPAGLPASGWVCRRDGLCLCFLPRPVAGDASIGARARHVLPRVEFFVVPANGW